MAKPRPPNESGANQDRTPHEASRSDAPQACINQTHLHAILNTLADPVFVKDRSHRWVFLNESFCNFIGHQCDELIGKSDFDFFPAEQAQVFWEKDEVVFTTGQENTNEEYFTDASGVVHEILTKKTLYTDPVGHLFIVGVIRDVTEQKRAESSLRQKELELYRTRKLEAVGRLAGGVAHDFNNLLTGILGISEDLRRSLPLNDPRRSDFDEIRRAIERAFAVTRQLLAFGGRQRANPEILDINECLADFHRMLQRLIGENVDLQLSLNELAPVKLDRGHLEQIVMNLVLNARDAVRPAGRIEVRTGRVDLRGNEVRVLGAPAGPYVFLEVADNGEGMDPEVLAKIFEPFFTTKSKEKGTGLGLATVYGIVEQLGGDIQVYSEPKKGTSFRILFPAALSAQVSAPAPSAQPTRPKEGTVLVVEDEDIVRRVVVRRLARLGHHILQARSAEEALALMSEPGTTINVLLTDVVMPGMNGRELADRFQRQFPDAGVLFMSGYPEDVIATQGLLNPGINFIDKGHLEQQLEVRLSELLSYHR
jgi:PAS domain S-box-containing protein